MGDTAVQVNNTLVFSEMTGFIPVITWQVSSFRAEKGAGGFAP